MIQIGKINSLVVLEKKSDGYLLEDKTSSEKLLLPSYLIGSEPEIQSIIDAFVYLDPDHGLIASTVLPLAVVGEYALMRVLSNREFGAFFDWGLEKDLLVPGNEQKIKVQPNESHIVRICLEEGTNRVFGTTKLGKYIESSDFDIKEKDVISIVPAIKTELGYRVIINKKYIGIIYHNEIFQSLYIGEEYQGVVKKLRDDGLVDAALQIQGIKNLDQSKNKIMQMLKSSGGTSPLNDKSHPGEIKNILGMSKKTFKSAIGMLYKDKKILITKEGIKLSK
jgi:hypothetical protein